MYLDPSDYKMTDALAPFGHVSMQLFVVFVNLSHCGLQRAAVLQASGSAVLHAVM